MAYDTFSTKAPVNQSGLTAALIKVVQHNPRHPLTAQSNYPDEYPQFVNPTNDQMTSILVEDEVHPLVDVDTDNSNRCFLHHKPSFGATISASDGVIDTAMTDYEHGIIYFSTMPVGEFTLQYQADPDKYYGEYLQAVQDVIHCIVWLLGAGQTLNEGIKNAEMFVDSLPADLSARLPHAIKISALDRNLEIRSTTDTGAPTGTKHTITLGNGEDTVAIDAEHFLVRRSTLGELLGMRFGDETGDFAQFAGGVDVTGQLVVGVRHQSRNPDIDPSAVLAFETTGDTFTSDKWIASFYGDVFIAGDLFVMGQTVVMDVQRNIQVNVYEDSLEVGNDLNVLGNVAFGVSTSQRAYFSGNVEITGGLKVLGAGAEPVIIDGKVIFTNGAEKGVFEQGTIDGLDPSYIECIRKYLRQSNKHGTAIEGMRTPLFEGTVSYVTGLDLIADTGIPGSIATAYPTGTYYTSKFDDGDYVMLIKTGDQAGARIPIKGYDDTTKQWSLARALDGAYAEGDEFAVFHELNDLPNFVQIGTGLAVVVKASSIWPLLGWQSGVIKKRTSDYEVTGLPANSTVYIFMSTAPGVNGIDEDEPTFFYSDTSDVESDQSILIAKAVTGPGTVTSVTCYAINAAYDTLWTRFETTGSGYSHSIGAEWTIDARMANKKRWWRQLGQVEVYLCPDNGSNGPDLTAVKKLDLHSAGFYLKTIADDLLVLGTPSAGFLSLSSPYWVRVVVC